MARNSRIVIPDHPHHVTQRTVRQAPMFFSDDDRKLYLRIFSTEASLGKVRIWAYCLMTNHVHFILVPPNEDSLAKLIKIAHSRYATYFNSVYGFSGHLMQGRFYSCPLRQQHLWSAIRYVERNPVEAHMVSTAEDYAWSSAKGHCQLVSDPLLDQDLPSTDVISDWSYWLKEQDNDEVIFEIRKATKLGRFMGTDVSVPRSKGTDTSVPR